MLKKKPAPPSFSTDASARAKVQPRAPRPQPQLGEITIHTIKREIKDVRRRIAVLEAGVSLPSEESAP